MCKFKVGDEVVLVNVSMGRPPALKNGITGIVLETATDPYVEFNVKKSGYLHSAGRLGEDGKCYAVFDWEIELVKPKKESSFKTSNRYKLHKYISSTGFAKYQLGLMIGKSKEYFSNETKESRFIERGDMSDARYKALRKQVKDAVAKTLPVKINKSGFVDLDIANQNLHKPKIHKEKSNDLEIFLAVVLVSSLIFIFGYFIYAEM